MKPQEYRKYILNKLIQLEREVEILGSLNLRDINIDSENFYRDLLNLLYNLNLENSNVVEANHDTFDLHDKIARRVYQVTSSVTRDKVNKTISQFERKYLAEYDELYMVFLDKKNLLETPKRKTITAFDSTFGFNVDRHLIDNTDILKRFDDLHIDKKIETYQLVKKYFEEPSQSVGVNGENVYQTHSKIPREEILNKFIQASHHLIDYGNDFYGIPNSHLERQETHELLQWIKTPIPKNERSVALLVGDAGRGKTVILKDLFLILRNEGIPVVGLKADRYYAESLAELEQKVHFEDSFEKMLRKLTTDGESAVVLIDQIDALSQSLSAKRQYIDSYNLLVRKLMDIPHVRIILSVRSYDLNYDTDLSFYKKQRSFSVGLLELDQVKSILDKLNIQRREMPEKLIELLRTPHHLNVFCKVFQSELNLGSIKTLHDLYNRLWLQRIIKVPPEVNFSRENLEALIFSISRQMYQEQRISTSSAAWEVKYSDELQYLKSNGILLNADREIHFFHQTFFDFAFAKQFVAGKESILEYLESNHQGLFVRSSVKMILSFLREQDHPKYIYTLKNLLLSRKYRYHLKVMTLNLVGYLDTPTANEKILIGNSILSSRLREPFLESVNSSKWLEFLIHKGVISDLLNQQRSWISRIKEAIPKFFKKTKADNEKQESLRNLCFLIFRRHLPKDRALISNFLLGDAEFEGKEVFVFKLLYFTKVWDQKDTFLLYERYKGVAKEDWFGHYTILEDMISYDFQFVLDEYSLLFEQKMKGSKETVYKPNIKHYDEELFKKIFQSNAAKAFPYFLELLDKVGESPFDFFNYGESTPDSSYGIDLILALLLNHVRNKAPESPDWFKTFYQDHRFTDKTTIQMMIIEGFQTDPQLYIKELFEFLNYWTSSDMLETANGTVHYYVRKLIGITYSLLEPALKVQLDINLLVISPKNEKELYSYGNKNRHSLRHFGYTQFLYLGSLPKEEVIARPLLKKRFLELQRKFGKVEDREPNVFTISSVGPPMDNHSYEHMSHDDWISTFKKYDENHSEKNFSAKGSLLEHANTFCTEVERRPDFFLYLVERIIDENIVHQKYITSGIAGLVNAKVDPHKLQEIFHSAIRLSFDREHTLSLVWVTSYFILTRVIDKTTFDFLIILALQHPDPDDKSTDGASNVRGAATSRIIETYFNSDFEFKIFDTLDKVANDPHISVRVAIISGLSSLLHLNENKTLDLFLKLVEKGELGILKHSLGTAQYIAKKHFIELIQYFKRMMEIEKYQEHVSTILSKEWVYGRDEAELLMNELFFKSEKAIAKAISVAVRHLEKEDSKTQMRCFNIYSKFLNSSSDEIASAYNNEFLHIKPNMFEKIYHPILLKYANSNVCQNHPNYYLKYLLKCVKKHPEKCIQLIQDVQGYDKPDHSKSGHYEDDAIKVLIGAYNSLNSIDPKPLKNLDSSMNLFDKLLMDERFRASATEVIEVVDR